MALAQARSSCTDCGLKICDAGDVAQVGIRRWEFRIYAAPPEGGTPNLSRARSLRLDHHVEHSRIVAQIPFIYTQK